MFEYGKEQARKISFWLVTGNLVLTLLLIGLIFRHGWTLFWPISFIPIAAEYVFFLLRGWISGWYFPPVRILFLLAHAALPVIGWFILDKGNYLGKKLIRISLAISVGVAIYTIILIGVSGFAWLESAGLVFPCFVEDLLFIYLLRRAVNVWKPS